MSAEDASTASPSDQPDGGTGSSRLSTFSARWTRTIQTINKPFMRAMLAVTRHAATHPKSYIVGIIFLSIALPLIGLATNFQTENDGDTVWTPRNSRPVQHGKWVDDESGFPEDPRAFVLIVHNNGENVLGDDGRELAQEGVRRVFESLDAVRSVEGYDELCQDPSNSDTEIDPLTGEVTCGVVGVTSFWNDSAVVFDQQVSNDEDVAVAMSSKTYPEGRTVDFKQIIGYAGFDEDDVLNYGQTYVTVILLAPNDDLAEPFEKDALKRALDLQESWEAEEGNVFRLEVIAERSFEDEFARAVETDIPLMPAVFVLMSILCVIIFSKRDRIKSQSLLGFGAVVTVLLAIMTSFGLLFICGVPFTNLTPILPFIMFGVGLDDAFIISGSYGRTDYKNDAIERVHETISDVGSTILMTTCTAAVAFGLGAISSIPAVFWLVAYAFPTIIIDFIYQLTFFIALIVLDDKRMKDNRLDCVVCCKSKRPIEERDISNDTTGHAAERFMAKYANFLVKPWMKGVVIVFFTALLALCSYSTSNLEQYFNFTSVIPSDSYIQTWWDAYNDWYERSGTRPFVYFRNVDFSDDSIQDQMESYVNDLAALEQFGGQPVEFWLRDFREFVASNNTADGLSFNEQVDMFLNMPLYNDIYSDHIIRNAEGDMTASRTVMNLDNVDYLDVIDQMNALEAQREVTRNQPINEGLKDWAFFTFTSDYYLWEFYNVAADEVTLTTVLGVVSVSLLGMLFIPHWSAILWVGALVSILYIDLLGFAQVCGITVNPVMYIAMVMSIGLMVDYVMHITLRFIELKGSDRVLKTKETLKTIGASVMVGGLSTMLGVLPLAFSTSEIFFTVFIIFFGLVLLGLAHGLILLPVLLSLIGPLDGPGTHEITSDENVTKDIGETEREADVEEGC